MPDPHGLPPNNEESSSEEAPTLRSVRNRQPTRWYLELDLEVIKILKIIAQLLCFVSCVLLRSFYAPFPVCYVVLGEGRWVEKNHVLQGLSGWSRFCRAS